MRTLAIVLVGAMVGSLAIAPAASARPGGGHGKGAGGNFGFAGPRGPSGGFPAWQGSSPPGFSMGRKSGWSRSVPPGWQKGRKKGWSDRGVPPGLYGR